MISNVVVSIEVSFAHKVQAPRRTPVPDHRSVSYPRVTEASKRNVNELE
jgi:hypothetical protein